MRTLTTYSLTLYKHHHFVMVLVFILLGLNCKATIVYGDTSRSSYPINDPRNPNCPCHLYQKMADEEYKQLLGNANPPNSNSNIEVGNHQGMTSDTKSNPKRTSRSRSQLKIKFTSFHNRKINTKRKIKKRRKFIKRIKNIDDCFRF